MVHSLNTRQPKKPETAMKNLQKDPICARIRTAGETVKVDIWHHPEQTERVMRNPMLVLEPGELAVVFAEMTAKKELLFRFIEYDTGKTIVSVARPYEDYNPKISEAALLALVEQPEAAKAALRNESLNSRFEAVNAPYEDNLSFSVFMKSLRTLAKHDWMGPDVETVVDFMANKSMESDFGYLRHTVSVLIDMVSYGFKPGASVLSLVARMLREQDTRDEVSGLVYMMMAYGVECSSIHPHFALYGKPNSVMITLLAALNERTIDIDTFEKMHDTSKRRAELKGSPGILTLLSAMERELRQRTLQ
ncbi:MAG: hypothetical protein ACP5NX_04640 [Candidatus Bilamarchaeaceae archaeon]